MITKTTIQCDTNRVLISRLINHKLQCIEFDHDVLASAICEYFNMQDEQFIKLTLRLS